MSTALTKRSSHTLDGERTRDKPLFQPHVDILETEDELRILADMPGADRESLDVNFDNNTLSIRAKMAGGLWPDGGSSMWTEYGVGDYYRAFQVGKRIDPERISAEYADGVLTVHLPKVEAARPRKISVTVRK